MTMQLERLSSLRRENLERQSTATLEHILKDGLDALSPGNTRALDRWGSCLWTLHKYSQGPYMKLPVSPAKTLSDTRKLEQRSHLRKLWRSPEIGDRLRAVRLELGLSQMDIQKETGISWTFLNSIELKRRKIGHKTALTLSTFYGVSLDWIFKGGKL